jgi:hypothetical protein
MQSWDEPGGCPSIGQVVSGMEVARACSAASARNLGRRTTKRPSRCGGERESVKRKNREALSTVAACAGGSGCSSDETSAMEAERRTRLI